MNTPTIIWIALPLFIGFSSYLLPRSNRFFALGMACVSMAYGLWHIVAPTPLTIELIDNFGVTLVVDGLSGYFVLTNALVTAAVVLYCWQKNKSKFFYTQTVILHGSVNAVFICAALISLYVALEVIGIAAFLLMAYPRSDRAIWVGLRYLFVSNTAMLFYLMGAALVYQTTGVFAFTAVQNAPPAAIALLMIGLFTKGGIFVSGLWLPLTHAEADTPVSAMLSGAVVKTGVFPLVRLALMADNVAPAVQLFSMGTAFLGVTYAIFEKDTKRMLASSTISQMGFVLANPAVAGFYALTHGLAKAVLFLLAGNLPSRKFQMLQRTPMARWQWLAVTIAALSISGMPLLSGFEAKALTVQDLPPTITWVMNLAALGTAIAFAKFIFLPFQLPDKSEKRSAQVGFGCAIGLLLGGLVLASGQHLEIYSLSKVLMALATLATGWAIYGLWLRRGLPKLPTGIERFEHLIGGMSLMLLLLLGMVAA